MAFELPPPGAIPDFDDLEKMAAKRHIQIVEELSSGPVEAEVSEKVVTFSNKLHELLVENSPEEERESHAVAIERALQIAIIIVDRALSPRKYDLSLRSMATVNGDTQKMLEFLYDWPHDYLKDRPHLGYLLESSTESHNTTDATNRDIVVAGGLIFAQVDEDRLDKYVDFHMRKMTKELPRWEDLMNDIEDIEND